MSSRSQKEVSDLFDRFAESEQFAGTVVEFGGDPVQLGLGMHGEVAAQSVPLCLSSGWFGRRRVVGGGSGK